MDEVGKFWAWIMACGSIVVVVLISCVTYYKVEQDKLSVTMAKIGYNPAIVRCVKTANWSVKGDYDICQMVLSQENLTVDSAKELLDNIDK